MKTLLSFPVLGGLLIAGSLLIAGCDDENSSPTISVLGSSGSSPVVDTGQTNCYDNTGVISCPEEGEAFYGQDAQFTSNTPSYMDNGDGTVTDYVTGLVWAQNQSDSPMQWSDASSYCESLSLGDNNDWRVPSLKELWSIRDFSSGWPYVNTRYFSLVSSNGAEPRQQHTWSSNNYLVDTGEAMQNVAFAVNDWTGHIKALDGARYVRCVSGSSYLTNSFVSNGDGTINDQATGLMWMQNDNGEGLDWEDALAYADNLSYAGYDDWRVPNVKELQSIVDYSGVYPAIDQSYFNISDNDAYFWTSTTVGASEVDAGYYYAWYVAFGYAVGPDGEDTHGAGAVRFDTKVEGGPAADDSERVYNYVRLVRDAD